MSEKLRLTIDTNIFISAFITKGTPPYRLLKAWKEDGFILITSHAQMQELARVLRKAVEALKM